ncbi:MAG: DUF2065 domain-containing protein [Desulfuromonas sp.]|uniref:DUF2065 domain-containing protein n=1 Tax=Desulfuromonas sp. TaxID=892 RepID=UPI000CB5805A|nr:DUF2065 domain-containing protein [Desulfuromonas sp.]PLX85115.1 MAG: DUF2065 domain-containing protein [Desulfuromonas sp.]
MEFFLTVIGVVMIVEGVPWFLSPRGVKRLLLQAATTPEYVLRFLGLSLMLAGLFLVYLTIG